MPCPSCAKPCRIPAASATRKPGSGRPALAPAPRPEPELPEDYLIEEVEELEEVDDAADEDESVPLEVVRPGRRRKQRLVRRRPDGNLDRVNLGLGFYYASIIALLGGLVVELAAMGAGITAGFNALLGSSGGAMSFLGMAMLLNGLVALLINWVAPFSVSLVRFCVSGRRRPPGLGRSASLPWH